MEHCYGVYIHLEELDKIWIEEAAKAKLGLVAIHPAGGNDAHHTMAAYLETVSAPLWQERFAALREKGIAVETAAHALSWLLPREEFEAHPEWFRLNEEGKREAEFNCCCASKEALIYIAKRAKSLVGKIPADNHRYHLWADDVARGVCTCDYCRNYSAADQALIITNAILAGLRQADPQAKLSFLAYHATMELPQKITPAEGVYLEYAPMDRDYDRPLSDPSSAKNAAQLAPLEDLLALFGKKDATALDYWYDNSLQSGWKKPPVRLKLEKEVMQADVKTYGQKGFDYITTFACYLGPDYRELHGDLPDLAAMTEGEA